MKEPKEDDERLSALLEGRVEGRQREELLAHLSAADDDYEVFTDTAAVLRALEEEDARGPVPVPSMRRGGWRSPGLRTALAVTGTLVLFLALGLVFRGSGGSGADPLHLAIRADPDGGGLPDGWTIPASVRGEGVGTELDARAVQAGALLIDLSVAARAGKTEQIRLTVARLRNISEPGASAGTPLGRIEAHPEAPVDSLTVLLDQAANRLAKQLGPEPLELGAWLEAARLAAHAGKASFFQDGASRGMLRRAERLAGDNDTARAAVSQVRTALPVGGAPRWEMLGDGLRALLSELSA